MDEHRCPRCGGTFKELRRFRRRGEMVVVTMCTGCQFLSEFRPPVFKSRTAKKKVG